MFRLEKVFQNDDKFFLYLRILLINFGLYSSVYLYSILEKNTIYDLKNYQIYTNGEYYRFSIYLFLIHFIVSFIILNNKKYFVYNFKYNFKEIIIFFICIICTILIIKINKHLFTLNVSNLIFILLLIISLFFFQFIVYRIYNFLIRSNIIQRNIMLIGKLDDVIKILNEDKNNINIYKCCLILNNEKKNKKDIRGLIKIPVFFQNEDFRLILEYHHLGQIWILNNKEIITEQILKKIFNFSVDILIINLKDNLKPKSNDHLINNKYIYINYEMSRFYGINFFIKILIDKFLSIIFLIISLPVLIISILLIYFEDGFPVIFTQDRTGWDGRRFEVYKLRTLKNIKYDPTVQVRNEDNRKLKIGKFIRRFSIDELPQFLNVLKGEMSIVGPRPHPVALDLKYFEKFQMFLRRYKSNPGITGWAQIHGFRGATEDPNDMKKRMYYDLWYLENWTILLDIYIIFKTFYAIFKFKGD
jgi:lipopolysaccharide/colanic/teichoic acid biosynthesis glycosyltransferase